MSDSCECGYQYQPPHKESDAARHQAHCVLWHQGRPHGDGYPSESTETESPAWVEAWRDVGRAHFLIGKPPDRKLVGRKCWPYYGAGYFEASGNTAYYPVQDDKNDTGGPAFPAGYHPEGNSADQHGMTLRDWFAGMALQGYLAGRNYDPRDSRIEVVSRSCYAHADAMLAARKEYAS